MGSNHRRKVRTIKQLIVIILLITTLVLGFRAYDQHLAEQKIWRAHFVSSDGKRSPEYRLELANTPAQRQLGLMYRKAGSMAADEGMVFVFPGEQLHGFWMKNTFLPLDMIFLDQNLQIVGIEANAAPLSEEPRGPATPAKYVIELNSGITAKDGIKEGAKAVFARALPPGER